MNDKLSVFREEYGLFTSFKCGNKTVDDVQIVLNFSEITPSKINGKIVGNPLKYNELVPLLQDMISNNEFSFDSSKMRNQRKIFSSNEIQISKFPVPIEYPSNYVYDVLPFELQSLKICEEYPTNKERKLQFLLEGPRGIWGFINYDVINNQIIPKNELAIEIDEKLDFEIKLEVNKHKREDEKNKSLNFEYETIALTFITKLDSVGLSDENFITNCTKYIKDILLLVSFLGKKRIEWFCYYLYSDNKITTYIRDLGRIDSEENNFRDYIIGQYGTLKFLKKHLPLYRKLKDQNFDLFSVIIFYLSSLEMKFLESEFSTMFTALEYLKSLYCEKNNLNKIIINNNFKKLNKIIKHNLYEFQENNSKLTDFHRNEQIKKIPELNRYSISTIINKMCSEYEINLEEYYPTDESISLYNTRNKLIHESYEIDIELLSKEYVRLRLIVEKLILKILKWEDFDEMRNMFEIKYITESETKTNNDCEVQQLKG